MSKYFEEVYFDVEKAIELAFDRKFVLNFYEYLKLKGAKKVEVDQFLNSSTPLLISVFELFRGFSTSFSVIAILICVVKY